MKPLFATILSFLISTAAMAQPLRIAAAISLKDALQKVSERYKADTGAETEFTFGSSGQLAAQIKAGAPIDLFISAANRQVDDLIKADAVDPATRRNIAANALVLIVPPGATSLPRDLKVLADGSIKRIALGEPKTVPAGQYAMQALEHAGIADALKEKLIMGTNVRQVLDYVERGEVSAGLVYATDAKIAGDKVRIAATIDPATHEPIVYPAILIKSAKNQPAAQKFLDYLASEKGQSIFKQFGFESPSADHPAKPSK